MLGWFLRVFGQPCCCCAIDHTVVAARTDLLASICRARRKTLDNSKPPLLQLVSLSGMVAVLVELVLELVVCGVVLWRSWCRWVW